MKKLILAAEDLVVESFDTASAAENRGGTVRAHETGFETCYDRGCPLSYWTDCHRC